MNTQDILESDQHVRDRWKRVVGYIKALHQHRNPVKRQVAEQIWHLWFRDLPDHPYIQKTRIKIADGAEEDSNGAEGDYLLKVRRPRITVAPQPPNEIREWIKGGWEDPFKDVAVHESRNRVMRQGETYIEHFHDDPERVAKLKNWELTRKHWAENEKPTRMASRVFERLYQLHGMIQRDSEQAELILGDGILNWYQEEGGIHHPVLLKSVNLAFEASIPEFTIVESDRSVGLYEPLFYSTPSLEGRLVDDLHRELESGGYHPLDADATSGFLKSLVHRLSHKGQFIEGGMPEGEKEIPRIGRSPVLFLRRRSHGYAAAIDTLLSQIEHGQEVPTALKAIVGIHPTGMGDTPEPSDSQPPKTLEFSDVLLTKEANAEQIRIARALDKKNAVLVQGPPGTGKSHTIANLIGHLLAQGMSILVTAHTTKALRVLRALVVPQIRPLCVSILESDAESRKQLESSVREIAHGLSNKDPLELERLSRTLQEHRRAMLTAVHDLKQQLHDAVASEYKEIVIGGTPYKPLQAAKFLAKGKKKYDWIPAPVTAGAPLPLSEKGVLDLYRTNRSVSALDEKEILLGLPSSSSLPRPDDFRRMISAQSSLERRDRYSGNEFWSDAPPVEKKYIETLKGLHQELQGCSEYLANADLWQLTLVEAGRRGDDHRAPWVSLLQTVEQYCKSAVGAREMFLKHNPRPPDLPLETQLTLADEILKHLQSDSPLNRFTLSVVHRNWGKWIKACRVEDGHPKTEEHFEALRTSLMLRLDLGKLRGRWDRQMLPLGATASSKLGDDPTEGLRHYSERMHDALGWYRSTWKPLQEKLQNLDFSWESLWSQQLSDISQDKLISKFVELECLRNTIAGPLATVIQARINSVYWAMITKRLTKLRNALNTAANKALVNAQLCRAVDNLDPDLYGKAFKRLVALERVKIELDHRQKLLSKLKKTAPEWASAVCSRSGLHGGEAHPGSPPKAWLWRQFNDEFKRRHALNIDDIQKDIEELRQQLIATTADLVDRSAWANQVRRTRQNPSQRQALIGWLDTIRRIGRGTGRRTPRLRRIARQQMSECKEAVPVWIMPLSRVMENVSFAKTRFDVLIIDEASQSDVMALLAFWLAKKVVIVGDHEQVSPAAVGQKQDFVERLIEGHLKGIPNAHLYDGKMSIYDLARQSFGDTICLLEHFRCAPNIIGFSNLLSYDGKIKPLRDSSSVDLHPSTVVYQEGEGEAVDKVNRSEALTVVALLAAAVEQPEYEGKSMGVISMVGIDQAITIENFLRQHVEPQVIQDRRILCGNPAQFQGDERDIVFLSMVDSSDGSPLRLRQDDRFRQRFNVAASRAKDQVWIIHSLDTGTELKDGDLRKRLIEYARAPEQFLKAVDKAQQKAESPFEKDVIRRLVVEGYQVEPQYQVGNYRIDIVVFDNNGKRLAIECDGAKYHPLEKVGEDMQRQAILERIGWKFKRIRGSQFYREPDRAMQPVFERLEKLGVERRGTAPSESEKDSPAEGSELVDRVIRRAREIRCDWVADEIEGSSRQALPYLGTTTCNTA